MKISSAKAKGRRLQQLVRDWILKKFPELEPDDVRSTSMGVTGSDLQLSPKAKKIFPFDIECKNTESINIWKAIEQARNHGPNPIVIFSKNFEKPHVCLSLETFLEILNENKIPNHNMDN